MMQPIPNTNNPYEDDNELDDLRRDIDDIIQKMDKLKRRIVIFLFLSFGCLLLGVGAFSLDRIHEYSPKPFLWFLYFFIVFLLLAGIIYTFLFQEKKGQLMSKYEIFASRIEALYQDLLNKSEDPYLPLSFEETISEYFRARKLPWVNTEEQNVTYLLFFIGIGVLNIIFGLMFF